MKSSEECLEVLEETELYVSFVTFSVLISWINVYTVFLTSCVCGLRAFWLEFLIFSFFLFAGCLPFRYVIVSTSALILRCSMPLCCVLEEPSFFHLPADEVFDVDRRLSLGSCRTAYACARRHRLSLCLL